MTTLTTFLHASGRKGGPGGENTWDVVRLSSARSQHLTVVLRVRPCSRTTTLPRFAEGGSFFAAAATGGERSPSETMERYAFPRVRRACADDVRSKKAMIWGGFSHALVSRGENEAFGGLRALVSVRCPTICIYLCVPVLCALRIQN